MNTRSSTETELVGADKTVDPMLWILLFLKEQGYTSILYQDNKSIILLKKGCSSAGKQLRHLNTCLFLSLNK